MTQMNRMRIPDLRRSEWNRSLRDPTSFYWACHHYFHNKLPSELRAHRKYFAQQRRGFGEDSFHTMWFLLFREYAPTSFLEVGVYRGQTISLASLIAKRFGLPTEVVGISPFTSAGDSVSWYPEHVDYLKDTRQNFRYFSLPDPVLVVAFSTDYAAREVISGRDWAMIYVDGNHDYPVIKSDWTLCSSHLKRGGIIVLDDAALFSQFEPPPFATKGHLGPSTVAIEIDRSCFREVLHVGHNRVFQKI